MRNKLTAFLLSVVLCLSLAGTASSLDFTEVTDQVEFQLNETEGTVKVIVSGLQANRQYEGWTLTMQKGTGDWEIIAYFNPMSTSSGKWAKTVTVDFDPANDKMQLNMPDVDGGTYQQYGKSPRETAATPVISGTTPFTASTTVTITCATEGAAIYYALGTAAPQEYTGPFTLTATTTVTAYAEKDGMERSETASKTFTLQSVRPVVPPQTGGETSSGGSSSSGQRVTVTKTSGGSVTCRPGSPSKGTTVTITVRPNDGYVLDKLTVTDRNGKEISVTKVSDTEYTFIMPEGRATVTPVFRSVTSPTPSGVFSDVPSSHTFYSDISWVASQGYMSGYADGTFRPSANTTGRPYGWFWPA